MDKCIVNGGRLTEAGERVKHYSPVPLSLLFVKDAKFNLPVYLEDEVFTYIEGIAKKRKTDVSTIVNQLLRSDIQLVEAVK